MTSDWIGTLSGGLSMFDFVSHPLQIVGILRLLQFFDDFRGDPVFNELGYIGRLYRSKQGQ